MPLFGESCLWNEVPCVERWQSNHFHFYCRSLFPAGFRDRLMEGGKGKGGIEALLPENYLPMETPKLRLKNYLTDEPMNSVRARNGPTNILGSEPIADFFPNTTVLFADIAGFTAWSSTREPSQVFTLLETLYVKCDCR